MTLKIFSKVIDNLRPYFLHKQHLFRRFPAPIPACAALQQNPFNYFIYNKINKQNPASSRPANV